MSCVRWFVVECCGDDSWMPRRTLRHVGGRSRRNALLTASRASRLRHQNTTKQRYTQSNNFTTTDTLRYTTLLYYNTHHINYSQAYYRSHECKHPHTPIHLVGLPLTSLQIIEWAFGKRMTQAERLRKHQRALEKTQRELDRERIKLENQEKKLIVDIKKSAKAGQMGACKIQAKDLVRTRRYIEKFYSMRTQLQAISLRIQTVRTNEQMMQSMKGATRILGSMNRQMNLPQLQRIAMEFERENEMMDQRQEMMDDAIDDAMGVDDEAEGDEVVEQVLEEIGVDLRQAVSRLLAVDWRLVLMNSYRWERHPADCKARLFQRPGLHRLLAAAVVLIREMTTFRLV